MEFLIVDTVLLRLRSSILGVYYCLVLESTSVLTPGTGYLIDRVGSDRAFQVMVLLLLAAIILAMALLRRRRPRVQDQTLTSR